MSTHPAVLVQQNSTTDRSLPLGVRALRAWFRALAAVAPGLAEAHAAALFFTPRRSRREALRVPGAEARAFRVRAGGDRVACWSFGRGPTVLLVHGWEGASHDWAELAPRLVAAGYRVVAFDLPAHGRSAGRRTTLPEIVRAVHAIANHLALASGGRFEPLEAIVGHSFGAAAAALALRDGLLAGRAVLLAPVADPTLYIGQMARLFALSPATAAGLAERVRTAAGGDFARIDVVRAVTDSPVPGLVVHDRGDRGVPWLHGRALAEAWPRARFVETEGLGHRGVLRAPEVLRQVVDFIRD